MSEQRIFLEGLSGSEQVTIRQEIAGSALTITPAPIAGPRAGEPVTIAVIIVGKLALLGLSAFLLKKRKKHDGTIFVGDLRIETSDGVIEAKNIKIQVPQETTSAKDVLELLSKQLDGIFDRFLDEE